jgi:hypothetical protein
MKISKYMPDSTCAVHYTITSILTLIGYEVFQLHAATIAIFMTIPILSVEYNQYQGSMFSLKAYLKLKSIGTIWDIVFGYAGMLSIMIPMTIR